MRTLAIGGVVGPLLFAATVVTAAALRPDYSHLHHFISELGATGSANAALMNYVGFVPGGLLVAGFGLSLAGALPASRLATAGALLTVLFGAGVAVSGVVSCDPGCPQVGGSLENTLHDRIAPVSFLAMIVGVALVGLTLRGMPKARGIAVYSLASSVLALALLAALVGSLETRVLTGLWQRLLLTVLFGWCAVVGVAVFRGESRLRPTA